MDQRDPAEKLCYNNKAGNPSTNGPVRQNRPVLRLNDPASGDPPVVLRTAGWDNLGVDIEDVFVARLTCDARWIETRLHREYHDLPLGNPRLTPCCCMSHAARRRCNTHKRISPTKHDGQAGVRLWRAVGAGSYRRPGDGHKNFLSRTGTGCSDLNIPLERHTTGPNITLPWAGITVLRGKDFVFEGGQLVKFMGVDKQGRATRTIYVWA